MKSTSHGDVADRSAATTPHAHHRRLTVALLLASSALAACGDAPTAPAADLGPVEASATQLVPGLMPVIDDATDRLLGADLADSPLRATMATLRAALARHDMNAALQATADAQLTLEFSREAQAMDPADRDALLLQLGVIQRQLAAEAR